jgi:hypothetical protein
MKTVISCRAVRWARSTTSANPNQVWSGGQNFTEIPVIGAQGASASSGRLAAIAVSRRTCTRRPLTGHKRPFETWPSSQTKGLQKLHRESAGFPGTTIRLQIRSPGRRETLSCSATSSAGFSSSCKSLSCCGLIRPESSIDFSQSVSRTIGINFNHCLEEVDTGLTRRSPKPM